MSHAENERLREELFGAKQESSPDHLSIMAAVEQATRTAFERRYAGRTMTYEQSRELVWLERDLVETIGFAIQHLIGKAP